MIPQLLESFYCGHSERMIFQLLRSIPKNFSKTNSKLSLNGGGGNVKPSRIWNSSDAKERVHSHQGDPLPYMKRRASRVSFILENSCTNNLRPAVNRFSCHALLIFIKKLRNCNIILRQLFSSLMRSCGH